MFKLRKLDFSHFPYFISDYRVHFSLVKNKMCLLFLIITWTGREERQQPYSFLRGWYFITFPVNLFMRVKLRKNFRGSNFACWIKKNLVNLRFEANSVKFNNFAALKIKLTPLNRKPLMCMCQAMHPTNLGSSTEQTPKSEIFK